MTKIEPTTGTVLPEHEQELLDTALLESDQLLVRLLHDDKDQPATEIIANGSEVERAK